jgi:hypothetical protein
MLGRPPFQLAQALQAAPPQLGRIHVHETQNRQFPLRLLKAAVNDQLCFSNCNKMRVDFETAVSKMFNVELLGQARWCLQGRITQHANFSITLDQSRR